MILYYFQIYDYLIFFKKSCMPLIRWEIQITIEYLEFVYVGGAGFTCACGQETEIDVNFPS